MSNVPSKKLTPAEQYKVQQEIERLQGLLETKLALPHVFGFPWYKWAKEFHDSVNKACFMTAANQVSKSSTQIRKCIDWATDHRKWPKLWPNLLQGQKPNQFWYFYPTQEVWNVEWETKWLPDFMPRGKFKDDPTFGWKEHYEKGFIKQIDFNSGVTIYCKTYRQRIRDLQSGSVHAIFLDEECPHEYMPELQARLRAVDGYMNAVFTATLGQEFWRKVMEPRNKNEEIYPNALKMTVSLYDSQEYIDGTKSRWTNQRITQIKNECGTDAEVQRRVYGRFVKSEGLQYESFDLDRNMIEKTPIPKSWGIFSAVDPGSGGKSGHPAAMLFIAVRPDYKLGIIFKARRMDGIATANTDILDEYRKHKGTMLLQSQQYDYKDKDFYLVAQAQGESFQMANKSRDEGIGLLNTLFKNAMLLIQKNDPELDKLVAELQSVAVNQDKRKAEDDLIDCARYAVMAIPWDFSNLQDIEAKDHDDPAPDLRSAEQIANDERMQVRRDFALNKQEKQDYLAAEFEYWNDLSGAGND